MSDWFYGIDVSTRAVSIACVQDKAHEQDDCFGVITVQFPDSRGRDGRRLSIIRERTFANVQRMAMTAPPCFVAVEQASGRFSAPSLVYAVGVVQEACYSALCDLYDHPVQVQTMPSGTWKKATVGFGNAKKDEVFHWARKYGYRGESQDEADALAIAEAARKSVRFGDAEAA